MTKLDELDCAVIPKTARAAWPCNITITLATIALHFMLVCLSTNRPLRDKIPSKACLN